MTVVGVVCPRAGAVRDLRTTRDGQDLHGYRSHLAALEAETALSNTGEEQRWEVAARPQNTNTVDGRTTDVSHETYVVVVTVRSFEMPNLVE